VIAEFRAARPDPSDADASLDHSTIDIKANAVAVFVNGVQVRLDDLYGNRKGALYRCGLRGS
jgi:hypothetical protein